jgi:hypothetical protein
LRDDVGMTERPRTEADGAWYWSTQIDVPSLIAHTAEVDGRVVIDHLVISAPDITAATLRAVSLRSLIALAGQVLAEHGQLIDETPEGAALLAAVNAYPLRGTRRTGKRTATRAPLMRPDGTDPEGFSRRVAEAYNDAVEQTKTPAKVLAEEAGVPVTTVHRWVRDARRLGFLPPARKGRAG